MRPDRQDSILAPPFRKDASTERFLQRLNSILGPYERSGYRDLPERFPTLHIIGAPRSGTTLLTQLVASHLGLGAINNLIAAFWAAPCFGIRLSRHVLGDSGHKPCYESTFGRTRGPEGLHEFGYFWSDLLGYRDMSEPEDPSAQPIDWERFRRVVTNMAEAFLAPIVFKSFLLGFYINQAQAVLPKTCFLFVRRDPIQNALSILRARRLYSGSVNNWISIRPRQYEWLKDEPPATQAAGQVLFTESALERSVDRVGGKNVLQFRYEDLCSRPRKALERVRQLIEANGAKVELRGEVPSDLRARTVEPASSSELKRVREAVEKLAAQI